LYGEWLLSGTSLSTKETLQQPPEELLVQWIKTAWDDTSEETFSKGPKKCCVSDDMTETEDDIL
jgi:hypothetical protein